MHHETELDLRAASLTCSVTNRIGIKIVFLLVCPLLHWSHILGTCSGTLKLKHCHCITHERSFFFFFLMSILYRPVGPHVFWCPTAHVEKLCLSTRATYVHVRRASVKRKSCLTK